MEIYILLHCYYAHFYVKYLTLRICHLMYFMQYKIKLKLFKLYFQLFWYTPMAYPHFWWLQPANRVRVKEPPPVPMDPPGSTFRKYQRGNLLSFWTYLISHLTERSGNMCKKSWKGKEVSLRGKSARIIALKLVSMGLVQSGRPNLPPTQKTTQQTLRDAKTSWMLISEFKYVLFLYNAHVSLIN